jgi:hypothetical protein
MYVCMYIIPAGFSRLEPTRNVLDFYNNKWL